MLSLRSRIEKKDDCKILKLILNKKNKKTKKIEKKKTILHVYLTKVRVER